MTFFILSLFYIPFALLYIPASHRLHKFATDGNKPYCMIDYKYKKIHCVYETIDACRNDLNKYQISICYPNKFTK